MNKELNKRFQFIILELQDLRKKQGFNYEEESKDLILKYGKEIKDENLVSKCGNQHWAKQLCIMNCIPEKYWK